MSTTKLVNPHNAEVMAKRMTRHLLISDDDSVPGILIGCEVLSACQGDTSCVETIVYRLNLEYCLPNYKVSAEKRGAGRARMRNILLNSYLNRVW
ncbi:hypothetical protein NECAME_12273 [Necator americanus]|uniref:Uncharacterized protein n=1 Tax=Necator americanus TaxID=51031 RepID=W2T2Y5_NECAM|nr:hypothetical protein NECAME_12273 [Necator americanus]ETN75601.1 hypothetical protein NECAME_12273 [Necator americanus]